MYKVQSFDTTETHAPQEPLSPTTGPPTAAATNELVAKCGEALPEKEAVVWRLRNMEGFDFKAIAGQLGITDSSARGLHHRALDRLGTLGIL